MTDEARIVRLTELARRVWPEENVQLYADGYGHASISYRDGRVTRLQVMFARHPRALDALEKALAVLAGEDGKP